jgi:transposase
VAEAAVKYNLDPSTVKYYLRLYREETGLPARTRRKENGNATLHVEEQKDSSLKEYETMSKEELIDALIMARINEARLKKGYSVKGSGVEKTYIPIDSGNIK